MRHLKTGSLLVSLIFGFTFFALVQLCSALPEERPYNGSYSGDHLNRVAFPLGGLGYGWLNLAGVDKGRPARIFAAFSPAPLSFTLYQPLNSASIKLHFWDFKNSCDIIKNNKISQEGVSW